MEKKLQISITRKLILLILGANILCFAVGPKSFTGGAIEIEQQSKEAQDEDNKAIEEYYIAYEAIVPATQLHLSHDLMFVFDLFVLEEKDFEPIIEKPIHVNNHRKILFTHIITPNAP